MRMECAILINHDEDCSVEDECPECNAVDDETEEPQPEYWWGEWPVTEPALSHGTVYIRYSDA